MTLEKPPTVEFNPQDMLVMSPWDFDQSPDGWRKLVESSNPNAKQLLAAAELIRKYIDTNKTKFLTQPKNKPHLKPGILYFHVGQNLASAGEEHYEEAIKAFKESYHENKEDPWNGYVNATIGFLQRDITKVVQSIALTETAQREDQKIGGNIEVVRNFKKALEHGIHDYKKAYAIPKDVNSV